jgi:5-methylcytosine-specific restriction endonuclease McrA
MVRSSKTCRKCGRVHRATREFFGSLPNGNLRGTCRDCMNENVRNWSADNQESVRRRSRERQARVGRWVPSSELRQGLFNEQSGLCALCGKPIESLNDGQVEHLTPAVRGGSNHSNNLAIAHVSCNREKANKTLGEYIQWRIKVGLPASAYSSVKLKEAVADGELVARKRTAARAARRQKEAPVKTSWMPGKKPGKESKDKADTSQSARPAEHSEQACSDKRSTIYRYAGNIPPDDIRPVPGGKPPAKKGADDGDLPGQTTTRDTTYRFRRQDLTGASYKFN